MLLSEIVNHRRAQYGQRHIVFVFSVDICVQFKFWGVTEAGLDSRRASRYTLHAFEEKHEALPDILRNSLVATADLQH